MKTANEKFDLDCVYFNKSLEKWVEGLHERLCIIHNLPKTNLRPQSFAFDNFANCIGDLMEEIEKDTDTAECARKIHNTWCKNFFFWKNEKPWISKAFVKPATTLEDEEAISFASSNFDQLEDGRRIKNFLIVEYVFSELKNELRRKTWKE